MDTLKSIVTLSVNSSISMLMVIFSTWYTSTLYRWFILSKFNAPELTFVQIMGILLLIGFLKVKIDPNKILDESKEKDISDTIAENIARIIFMMIALVFLYYPLKLIFF